MPSMKALLICCLIFPSYSLFVLLFSFYFLFFIYFLLAVLLLYSFVLAVPSDISFFGFTYTAVLYQAFPADCDFSLAALSFRHVFLQFLLHFLFAVPFVCHWLLFFHRLFLQIFGCHWLFCLILSLFDPKLLFSVCFLIIIYFCSCSYWLLFAVGLPPDLFLIQPFALFCFF